MHEKENIGKRIGAVLVFVCDRVFRRKLVLRLKKDAQRKRSDTGTTCKSVALALPCDPNTKSVDVLTLLRSFSLSLAGQSVIYFSSSCSQTKPAAPAVQRSQQRYTGSLTLLSSSSFSSFSGSASNSLFGRD